MVIDVHGLMEMTQAQLDDLFTKSSPGPIPDGPAEGTAIIAPGTKFTAHIASAINLFAWQGKTFDAAHGVLRNRISAFGLNAIVAEVYKGPSWLDQKECIVLDYSKTSTVAQWIRDEIRQIAPGLYLGKVYWEKSRLIDFALQFHLSLTLKISAGPPWSLVESVGGRAWHDYSESVRARHWCGVDPVSGSGCRRVPDLGARREGAD